MNKVYTVGPMQQIGIKLYFNIEKSDKRHKPWQDIDCSTSSSPLALGEDGDSKVMEKTEAYCCFPTYRVPESLLTFVVVVAVTASCRVCDDCEVRY